MIGYKKFIQNVLYKHYATTTVFGLETLFGKKNTQHSHCGTILTDYTDAATNNFMGQIKTIDTYIVTNPNFY